MDRTERISAVGSTGFEHQTFAQRLVFRTGGAETALAAEVARLGARRVLLIATPDAAARADDLTRGLPVIGAFLEVRPHVPAATADAARRLAARLDADLLLSVGGGSTTGTAKAVALTSSLPILAVPTTYAGSEATPVWGITDGGRKVTGVDERVVPRVVVYDAMLTATLPVELSVASGLNAMAHCVDSLWAPHTDPLVAVLAGEGIRALAEALPAVRHDGADLAARTKCLYAAYLSATAFASAGSGLHHKICHVLGGSYDLPHAATHAVVLPHVLAFNATAAPIAAARVAAALQEPEAVAGLLRLYDVLDAPRSLRELGLAEDRLDEATELVVAAAPPSNPRPVTADGIGALLRRAWHGDPPAAIRAQ